MIQPEAPRTNRPLPIAVQEYLQSVPADYDYDNQSALELGCGQGATAFALARRGFDLVMGIDASDPNLATARKIRRQRLIDPHKLVFESSLKRASDETGHKSFNLGVATNCLHGNDKRHRQKVLAVVKERVEPGGTVVASGFLDNKQFHNPFINKSKLLEDNELENAFAYRGWYIERLGIREHHMMHKSIPIKLLMSLVIARKDS